MLAVNLPESFCAPLIESHDYSRRQQRGFLNKRMDMWRQFVGQHYSMNGAKAAVPAPFIRMMVSLISRQIAARSPHMMVESRDPRLRTLGNSAQMWCNDAFDDMGLESVLQLWALESCVYPIVLTKLCYDYGQDGSLIDPYLHNIDPERACWDMSATDWKDIDHIEHRYTIDNDLLVGEGFDEVRVRNLQPTIRTQINEMGEEKSESLSQENAFQGRTIRPKVDVWEFYIPREGLEVSFAVSSGGKLDPKPIRVKPYVGQVTREHRTGPFYKNGFDKVGGQLMPSPVVHIIYDKHMAINGIIRKLLRQARDQKSNTLVQSTFASEGDALKRAKDQDVLPVTDPKAFTTIRSNGPDPQNLGFAQQLKQWISWFGGNFDALGGLGPQSNTLGQDEMLNAGASKAMQFMQAEFTTSTRYMMRGMAWYPWHSAKDLGFTFKVPGTGIQVPHQIKPQERPQGSFDRMKWDIHPYSMAPATPQMRMAQWKSLFLEYIMPAAPILAQQGRIPDVAKFIEKMAGYMGIVDVDEVMTTMQQDPAMQEQGGGAQEIKQPQREGVGQYTRTNVSTEEGQDAEILQSMQMGDAA